MFLELIIWLSTDCEYFWKSRWKCNSKE